MLLRQIRYFQSVVECGSFTEAAENNHISQSAISQQIKALEDEFGFPLMIRKNRTFELTPAGRYFYEHSIRITDSLHKLVRETEAIALDEKAAVRLGYLKNYGGSEFQAAIAEFAHLYPNVNISICSGTHEELYQMLVKEQVDLVISDQRRAFADTYNNLPLKQQNGYIEVPAGSFLASLEKVNIDELDSSTCILVTSPGQEETDKAFYRDILGFRGEYLTASSMEEGRMLMLSGKGFLPIEGSFEQLSEKYIRRIPLYRNDTIVSRLFCAFWKKDNSGYYIEEFADILHAQFQDI